jgi:hypothetical protein
MTGESKLLLNNNNINNCCFTINNNSIIIDINNINDDGEFNEDQFSSVYIKNPLANINYFYNRFNFRRDIYNHTILTSRGGFYSSTHLYDTNVTYFFTNQEYPKRLYRIIIDHNESIIPLNNLVVLNRENSNSYYNSYQHRLNKYPKFLLKHDECQICYNNDYIYQIHDSFDHSFCDKCLARINRCPICREEVVK